MKPLALTLLFCVSLLPLINAEESASTDPNIIPKVTFENSTLAEISQFISEHGNVNVIVPNDLADLTIESAEFSNISPRNLLMALAMSVEGGGRFSSHEMDRQEGEQPTFVLIGTPQSEPKIETAAFNLRPIYHGLRSAYGEILRDTGSSNEEIMKELKTFDTESLMKAVVHSCEEALETRLEAGDPDVGTPKIAYHEKTIMMFVSGSPETIAVVDTVMSAMGGGARASTGRMKKDESKRKELLKKRIIKPVDQ